MAEVKDYKCITTEVKDSLTLSLIPKNLIDEIIGHCKTCTFKANTRGDVKETEELSSRSCVLRVWLANMFSPELSTYFHPYDSLNILHPYNNLTILHLLLFQSVNTKEQRSHQKLASELLLRSKKICPDLDFDVDRALKWKTNGEEVVTRKPLIFSSIIGGCHSRLEIMISHGADVNIIMNDVASNSQYTPLHVCVNRGQSKIDYIAARMLLRANAKIEIEYTSGRVKTRENIYRHLLNASRLTPHRKDLRKFARVLKTVQQFKNVFSRTAYRIRRRKLIAALNSSVEVYGSYDFHFSSSIVADYLVPLLVIRL